MNLQQAKRERDKYKNLIGRQFMSLTGKKIEDIIVVPLDAFGAFISNWDIDRNQYSNDEMLKDYVSSEYDVYAIAFNDPEGVDIFYCELGKVINEL